MGGESGQILNALNSLPEVKGIAFGTLGEFSSSVSVIIDGFAHEGALKNPDRYGESDCKAAYGATHLRLKRRWSRLAVITALASRHDALRALLSDFAVRMFWGFIISSYQKLNFRRRYFLRFLISRFLDKTLYHDFLYHDFLYYNFL